MIIKPIKEQIEVTTEDSVEDARLVRVYAPSANTLVTIASGNTVIGSFTMGADSVEIVEKNSTDTIAASATILCTPVSYKS
jgi:hypothetical protein